MITQITEDQAREMLAQTCIADEFFEDGIREWKKAGYIKKSAMEEYQDILKAWDKMDNETLKKGIINIFDRMIEELRSEKK